MKRHPASAHSITRTGAIYALPLALLVTLSLLAIGIAQRIRIGPPPQAAPYLESVASAVHGVPKRQGTLMGTDTPVIREAFDLLQPNAILSRRYEDLAGGRGFGLLLVHCGDARDMFAHYPPICYPGSGWKLLESRPIDITLASGLIIQATEYDFVPQQSGAVDSIRVFNTLVSAGGIVQRDMQQTRVRALADNMRFFGAGQVQVIVPGTWTLEDRSRVYARALHLIEPALQSILDGPHGIHEGEPNP